MRIAMIGAGYVGLVSGVCFADLGNDVICIDKDRKKIESLNKNLIPIYEPGLEDIIKRNKKEKRLRFTYDIKTAIRESDTIFITVGTPSKNNGEADLSSIFTVAKKIGQNINGYKLVVNKSTASVGTARNIERIIQKEVNDKKNRKFDVASNPEFLREGEAIKDFMNPDRIVIGVEKAKAKNILFSLYKGIARADKPIITTSIESAELIKYASNAFLATKISFMNELSYLCEKTGADIKEIARGMGLDGRIGPRFLQAGIGYGGSCFPKDVKALVQILSKYGLESNILRAVDYVNEKQKKLAVHKLKKFLPNFENKLIAIWGLAFKPKTDDTREAPALTIIKELQEQYAKVRVFDPEAKPVLANVENSKDPYEAIKGADALIITTEWDEFRNLDKKRMRSLLKRPIIIDGRNVYEPKEMKRLGFKYQGIGTK